MLGYKVYHKDDMYMKYKGHSKLWVDYLKNRDKGAKPPFEELLAGFDVVLEFAEYHEELRALCPDAKLILTERDAEKWVTSATDRIGMLRKVEKNFWIMKLLLFDPQVPSDFIYCATDRAKRAQAQSPGNDLREGLLKSFNSHNALMKSLPNVIVTNSKNGWKDLCAGLTVDAPDVPYPFANASGSLPKQHISRNIAKGVLFWYILPLCGIIFAYCYVM